jgi:dipeptidyl aminopeptidase/acylaminoacyl peptidase
VSDDRVRRLLQSEPVPDAGGAEERAWRVIRAAYGEREAAPRRSSPQRLVLALVGAVVAAGLLLSPAGAAVRDWIREVVEPGEQHAAPALTSLPAPGRLLVESRLGPWVVDEDGSKRLLGAYDEAAWSPNGRFVAATDGTELDAVVADAAVVGEPDGTPRWSIDARRRVREPLWSPKGDRIAYRTGDQLRIATGDGKANGVLASGLASVTPAWRPLSPAQARSVDPVTGIANDARDVLAYVDAAQRLHVVDVSNGRELWNQPSFGEVSAIAWSPSGRRLLVAGDSYSILLDAHGRLVGKLPAGGEAAAFAPGGGQIALLAHTMRPGGGLRSAVSLLDLRNGRFAARPLYGGPGRLADLTWSPDGNWLLVAWPGADQWVFVGAAGQRRVKAVAGIADGFDAGSRERGTFPRVSGWIGD